MKKSLAVILLLAIFLATVMFRTAISLQTNNFSYDAYLSLRQIESINEQGVPIFHDELSYGGRVRLFSPVFFYLVSLFDFFGTEFAAKFIPNLLFSLIVFAAYLCAFQITKNRKIALLTSFFSGFTPVLFTTLNDVSAYSLVLVLMMFLLYFFMMINNDLHLYFGLVFLVLAILTNASAFILIVGFLFFLVLVRVESLDNNNREQEVILFATFLALWFYFIIYKNALLIHGPLVIWQNIPLQILTSYFFDLNLVQTLYYIGIVPFILGIYAIYNSLFSSKSRGLVLLISMSISTLILLWTKLISFRMGLIFLGLMLVLLSSHSLKLIYSYLKKTKIPSLANWFLVAIVVIFCLTAVIPSSSIGFSSIRQAPSQDEIDAMFWLKANTANDSVIAARLDEGSLITYFADRKNVIDKDFLLIKDSQERYDDIQSIFSLRLKTEVVRRLEKYGVDYIYFSKNFGTQKNLYYTDPDCFDLVYNTSVQIYEVKCELGQ